MGIERSASSPVTTTISLVVPILAVLLGFWLREVWNSFKKPKLQISGIVGPFAIRSPIPTDSPYRAYRVRVRNARRRLLSAPAENCMAWLEVNDQQERLWLSWVGGADVSKATINIGDERDADLIAVEVNNGEVIAPTERGYWPGPRFLSAALHGGQLIGRLRITSSNAGMVQPKIRVTRGPGQGGQFELDVNLEDC